MLDASESREMRRLDTNDTSFLFDTSFIERFEHLKNRTYAAIWEEGLHKHMRMTIYAFKVIFFFKRYKINITIFVPFSVL
jgi:hypothetical protein